MSGCCCWITTLLIFVRSLCNDAMWFWTKKKVANYFWYVWLFRSFKACFCSGTLCSNINSIIFDIIALILSKIAAIMTLTNNRNWDLKDKWRKHLWLLSSNLQGWYFFSKIQYYQYFLLQFRTIITTENAYNFYHNFVISYISQLHLQLWCIFLMMNSLLNLQLVYCK